MKFEQLSKYLEELEKTSSRLEITRILSELLKKSSADEVDKIVYLTLGRLAPSYDEIVFNLAERMMLAVIAKAYGKELDEIKSEYKKTGDLGDLACKIALGKKNKNKNLNVVDVYKRLLEIANDEGEGSQERKIDAMAKLLSQVDALSAKFLSRIPIGKLRLGFSDKTVIDALSWMHTGDKSKRSVIEKAYQVTPDVGTLAKNIKRVGIGKATKGIKPIAGVLPFPSTNG